MKDYARKDFTKEQQVVTPRKRRKSAEESKKSRKTHMPGGQKTAKPKKSSPATDNHAPGQSARVTPPASPTARYRQHMPDWLQKPWLLAAIIGVAAITGGALWYLLGSHQADTPAEVSDSAGAASSGQSAGVGNQDGTEKQAPQTPEVFTDSGPEPDRQMQQNKGTGSSGHNATEQSGQHQSASRAQAQQSSGNQANSPKFTFYDDLSNQQVQTDAKPGEVKHYKYTYMLQVGSYQSKEAANAIRAKLLLIDLKPEIKKIGDWYRVDVGPVHSKRQGDILQHKLEEIGISGSLLRQVSKEEVTPEEKSAGTTSSQ